MKEVTIDQTVLMRLLADPASVQLLPPLETLARKKSATKTCRPCGGRSAAVITGADRDTTLRELVNYLTSNPTARTELKKRLGASTIRIKHRQYPSTNKWLVTKL